MEHHFSNPAKVFPPGCRHIACMLLPLPDAFIYADRAGALCRLYAVIDTPICSDKKSVLKAREFAITLIQ